MKYLTLIITILFAFNLNAQSVMSETENIEYNEVDSLFFSVSEVIYSDYSEIRQKSPIGYDTTSVESYLLQKGLKRKQIEASAVKRMYESRGLGGVYSEIQEFSELSYHQVAARDIGHKIEGIYKVWIDNTVYNARIEKNINGVLRLKIPTVGNYTVLVEHQNIFTVRNYTPEHVKFYFVSKDKHERKTFMPLDFNAAWRIKRIKDLPTEETGSKKKK